MAWIPHLLLVGIAAVGLLIVFSNWGVPAPASTLCLSDEVREKARAIMNEGIDAALKQHTIQLYDNLLKDLNSAPERMTRGMRNAVTLYARSRIVLEKWNPPRC